MKPLSIRIRDLTIQQYEKYINTQEDEVNCMIYDYLHRHETISDQKIAEIVECVRELYDDLPEGNLYGY